MSETPASRNPVLLVVADTVDPRVVETLRHAMKERAVDVVVEPAQDMRRRVLVTDASRLKTALVESLRTMAVAEAPAPTWRDLLPDSPQFRQTGPRPPRRYRRR